MQFTDNELNAIAHYQSQYRQWGQKCVYADGRVFDPAIAGSRALYSLADKGFIRVEYGGPETYGHTDFKPTAALLEYKTDHSCPCEGCEQRDRESAVLIKRQPKGVKAGCFDV